MQLKKVTLKKVSVNREKKTIGIQIDTARGEMWFNNFLTARTSQLNSGETIWVYLFEQEYQGKKYPKFKLPSLDHLLTNNLNQTKELEKAFNGTATQSPNMSNPVDPNGQGINVDEINF